MSFLVISVCIASFPTLLFQLPESVSKALSFLSTYFLEKDCKFAGPLRKLKCKQNFNKKKINEK